MEREIEVIVSEGFRNEKPEVIVIQIEHPTWKARLACSLVERWGIVAGVPDGEDSAGRSKFGLMDVDHLVERACETADKMVEACRTRGWTEKLPNVAEQKDIIAARKAAAAD